MDSKAYNLTSVRDLFADEKCVLVSNFYQDMYTPLQYKCCCSSTDIHEINLKTFLKNVRCTGYNCRRLVPELNTIPTDKTCVTCNINKSIDKFAVQTSPRYIDSHKNICRECHNAINVKYRKTFNGYMKNQLKEAHHKARVRAKKGRIEAGKCDITFDDLIQMWEKQKGRCYYSNVPMNTTIKTDFQASIERLDTTQGYTTQNIVLCCLEFNDVIQWSRSKFNEMMNILKEEHDLSDTDFTFERRARKEFDKLIYDKEKFHQCNKCFEVKPLEQFNINKSIGCKSCVKVLDHQRKATPREALLLLLKHARANTKARAKKVTKKARQNVVDLTLEQLIDLYKQQKGLCAYSGLPLVFGNSVHTNWQISLERKNTLLGYTIDNVCFICYELNTGDKKVLYNDDSDGSCGWSADKFRVMLQYAKEMYQV